MVHKVHINSPKWSLSFLNVKLCRKNGKFINGVYSKRTFSGVFTNYERFIPTYQKRGLLHTLIHRSSSICCVFNTSHLEIDHLEDYPRNKQLSSKSH